MTGRATLTGTPDEAAALYFGDVMHARLKPIGHRFSYRVMSLLIDLDRLDEADRLSPLFAVNRAALYSFHEADHGSQIGERERLVSEINAWERERNASKARVKWMFDTQRARTKLRRSYPITGNHS